VHDLKDLGQDLSSFVKILSRAMSETTSSRLLTLLSLLQGRRDWPGGELADRLGVSGRTIRRDVERLRGLGYPVESMTGPAGGYQLRAGTAMPPLLLDDDEAIAIAVGLRTAAGASVTGIEETSVRALVKLEQVLPSHLRRRVRALQTATMMLDPGGPTVDPQCLTVIATACRDSERVRFGYTARDQATSRREVEPHSLVNAGRRWYLVAWDRDRADWRTFRVDRLTRPASTGVRFAPRSLPSKDAAAFVQRSLSTATYRYEARVKLHAPAEEARRHRWLGGTVEPLDASTCLLRTSDDHLDWLAMRVAMLGFEFEVEDPPELAERLRVVGERIVRAVGTHA
jgi:predicted DNA-binding transcriptional regulator YafY